MTQVVARLDDELVALVDELVRNGVVDSRSDAIRRGLHILIEDHRRRRTAASIIAGYQRIPQTDNELGWADEATIAMIGEETW